MTEGASDVSGHGGNVRERKLYIHIVVWARVTRHRSFTRSFPAPQEQEYRQPGRPDAMTAWRPVSRRRAWFDAATDDLAFVAPDNAAPLQLRLLIRLRGAGEQALL
jgi:hypothetical protein